MTELTALTLAEARDQLRDRELSAVELTDAHLAAIEQARALNAYVLETPDSARAMAKAVRCAPARRRRAAARRHRARRQGPVLHQGRAHDRVLAHPRQFRSDLRVDRHRAALARRRGDARQAQQRRVRHGLVERDVVFRPGDLAVAPEKRQHSARSGRLVGRLGGGGGGRALPRRDRYGYRRLNTSAGGFHRHRRHQAHLRPLLALGHRRVRLLARPGRAICAHGARHRDPARSMAGHDPKDTTSVDRPVPDYEAAVGSRSKA